MSEEPYNYLAIENGVNIIDCTSQVPNCPSKNMLSTDRKAIWLSCQGLPQGFTIDLSNQIKRPKLFSCFGFDCWHDYSSNPSMIELLASTDGEEFITWANIHPELRAGVQLFEIDPLSTRYNYLKVVVRETYGAPKTYINQIFLFEENPLKKGANTSKANESLNLNASDAIPGRRSATMGDVHFNENFHETLGQRHTAGSHVKPKGGERRQSGNDFNFLQFYEQSKDEDNSIDQRNSLAKPPTAQGMGYSNSMPKLNQAPVHPQPRIDAVPGNKGHPQTQRNAVSMSYSNLPNQFQAAERAGNISHDMINYQGHGQDRTRNRRNSYNGIQGGEYNHLPSTPQPKSSSGGTFGMISNQQKTFSNNPSPVMGRNPHYLQDQYDSIPQNMKPVPHDHPQNESFVSLLNDQITSMNDEVKKIVHNSGIKGGRDTYKPQITKASTEEDDFGFPLLTHSEKEVKQMKIEMNKWSGMMMGLQDNMSRLLQKVSDMQTNMDSVKTRSTNFQNLDILDTAKTVDNAQSSNHMRRNSFESMPSTDSFETLRAKITNYLENVINQNQVIIQENQKLRQNIDSVRKPHSPSKHEYNEASQQFSTAPQYHPQDIEKIVSDVFEKNMRSWKKAFYNDMKAELEERIEERINNELERLHEEDQGFKDRIHREMQELKVKVSYFEQQNNMQNVKNTVNMKSRSDKNIQEEVAPLKERKANNGAGAGGKNASKENIDYYQNNISMTTTAKKVPSSKDTTIDERRQKKQVPVDNEKPSLNSSTTSLAKIQHLMEKLNEKIALRDQKVQELQEQAVEVSSIADSDILDTSKDELAESLFAQKAKHNNVSNRKKIMK